ncbi:MAG: hypothetical protein HY461_02005 [Parcubacteria group bacterium]|nr:hypothetical protein [Parcubacteria group bacterium]
MLHKPFHKTLLKEYQGQQQQRHELIASANNALRSAKQAIFSLHRGDNTAARRQLDEVHKSFIQLQKTTLKGNPQLAQQGAYLAAIEEYLEAELFYQALMRKPLTAVKGLAAGVESYLGALSDLTGELTRQAVLRATGKDFKTVAYYADVVEEVVGALIEFDLTSHLRQKYDDAKRNLKRIESIRYDISLRD